MQWLARSCKHAAEAGESRHVAEGAMPFPPVPKAWVRDRRLVSRRPVRFPDANQLIRMRERKGPDQQNIRDAENRGVGSDTESQRGHGDQSERYIAALQAKRESQVIKHAKFLLRAWTCFKLLGLVVALQFDLSGFGAAPLAAMFVM